MPPKAKAKPKVQPRASAQAQAQTQAATTQITDPIKDLAGGELTAVASANTARTNAEEPLFFDDDSDDENPTGPFIVDEETVDTVIGDALPPPPTVEDHPDLELADADDGASSATEEGNPIPAMGLDDEPHTISDEDEDDPVVQSYDIIINTKLNEMLHLFQYPVRARYQPYTSLEGLMPYEARWKVESGLYEMDIPTNIDKNYDQEKGMRWGEAVRKEKMERGMVFNGKRSDLVSKRGHGAKRRRQGAGSDDESDVDDASGSPSVASVYTMDFDEAKKKGRVLKSQTLGAKIQPDASNYFVGVWQGAQLHLTKLHQTLQLRPQFPHVDIAVEQERAGLKAIRDLTNPAPVRPQEPRAVNLTVKPGENKFGESFRGFNDSLTKDLRKEEDEHWREVDWVDQDMDESWVMYENLFKQEPRELKGILSKHEYLDWCSAPKLEPENPLKGPIKKPIVKKENA